MIRRRQKPSRQYFINAAASNRPSSIIYIQHGAPYCYILGCKNEEIGFRSFYFSRLARITDAVSTHTRMRVDNESRKKKHTHTHSLRCAPLRSGHFPAKLRRIEIFRYGLSRRIFVCFRVDLPIPRDFRIRFSAHWTVRYTRGVGHV